MDNKINQCTDNLQIDTDCMMDPYKHEMYSL